MGSQPAIDERIPPAGTMTATAQRPVVIVGAGPVGMRVARLLLQRNADCPLVIYGAEPWGPYNRVRLSSLLAGEAALADLDNALDVPANDRLIQHQHCAVVAVDRKSKTVTDEYGRVQAYSTLVLATGSRPHIPQLPGIEKPGVYRFRDMNDVQQLMARQMRSRRTIVMGGGLLGLEAARAMQRANTEVVVVEHADRLMHHQLDEEGAERLREHMLSLGIQVMLGDGVQAVVGEPAASGLLLRSGRLLHCDTVVVATGIRANLELARAAGLPVGRGIKVNDRLQTADPSIYAVGECAEHRGKTYGLVAPGLEQSAVAVHNVTGGRAAYQGSTAATRLKVVGRAVFSMGEVGDAEHPASHRAATFDQAAKGIYRRLVLRRGRLVGAVAIGEWQDIGRLQDAIARSRRLWPWHLRRFQRQGLLWPAAGDNVSNWPADATVCNCMGITRGVLSQARAGGCHSVAALAQATGASTVCGSCKPLLAQLAGAAAEPVAAARPLLTASLIALVATALLLTLGPLGYRASVQQLPLDVLWTDGLWKQVSGYSLLALAAVAALLSARKRLSWFRLGDYGSWRWVHALVGAVAVATLLIHTGMNTGSNLNGVLMVSFLGVLVLGALAGTVAALGHRLAPAKARALSDISRWLHLAFAWPLPTLLGFHILSVYYF